MISWTRKALDYWRSGILLAVLGLTILSACQSDSTIPTLTGAPTPGVKTPQPEVLSLPSPTPTTAPTPTLPAHLAVDPAGLKGQKVQMWHPWQGDVTEGLNGLVKEFNQKNEWGIQVEVRALYSTGELFELVNAGLENSTGDLPDLVVATSDQLAVWAADEKLLVNLNEYIQDPTLGLSGEAQQALNSAFLKQDQSGSGDPIQLGLPALRSAQVLFYNVTWAKELGFNNAPKTPDEFKEQACAAAVHNNTSGGSAKYGTGGWIIDIEAATTLSWLTAFGANPVPAQEGQPYRFASDEAQEALTFLRDLQNDGCAWISRASQPYENFAQRKALFYSGGLPDIYPQEGWQERFQSQDAWTILPYPGQDGEPIVYAAGYSYALIQQDDHQAQTAAWLFTRWLSQPERAIKLAGALPSLPVSSLDAERLSGSKAQLPWRLVLPLSDVVRTAPSLASWRMVHRLVEDAGWQVYNLPVESVPMILPQLDQAVEELATQSP
jgi:ABC-type glycerol-3-phosphate transport system substrate-binding protein